MTVSHSQARNFEYLDPNNIESIIIIYWSLVLLLSLVRISEIRVYMLLYFGLFMDTGLAIISMTRLYDLDISA